MRRCTVRHRSGRSRLPRFRDRSGSAAIPIIVMMRATIGRRSFSTTARARIERKVKVWLHRLPSQVQIPIAAKGVSGAAGVNSLPGILIRGPVMRRKSEATRQKIIDAAYEQIWRAGFNRTSLDTIAARADVTKRTLYSYFRSKDDLLAAVLSHYNELAAQRLKRIGDRMPADRDGMIDSFFGQLAGWASATPRWSGSGFTRLVVELADLPGHPARALARRAKTATEAWLAEPSRACPRRRAARARGRDHAAAGRLDGADAHSRSAALYRCSVTRGEAACCRNGKPRKHAPDRKRKNRTARGAVRLSSCQRGMLAITFQRGITVCNRSRSGRIRKPLASSRFKL